MQRPGQEGVFPKFFKTGKTGPGEYGEGDRFLGVTVPNQRKIAKQFYRQVSLAEAEKLLQDPVHECRLTALFILVNKYEKSKDPAEKEEIIRCYLNNLAYVNNWDLVDSSAYKLLGAHLADRDRQLLYELAETPDLWKQRIAIIATFRFIKNDDFGDTFRIAEKLLDHPHDLIHKAVGWMLREVGSRDQEQELAFLDRHYQKMPRTMLRYAIEKLPPDLRQQYLHAGNQVTEPGKPGSLYEEKTARLFHKKGPGSFTTSPKPVRLCGLLSVLPAGE